MKIVNRRMSPEQFKKYLSKLVVWRTVDKLVFHHTSSPIEIWQGSASMLHYWNLYRSRGWKSGPHIFIAPDGIWLFTPIGKKGMCSSPAANKNSIHIEIVGRYFDKEPDNENICKNTAIVAHQLAKFFELIPGKDFYTHKFFEPFGGCSENVNADWVIRQIDKYL